VFIHVHKDHMLHWPTYFCDVLCSLDEPRQVEFGLEEVLKDSEEVQVGQGLLHQLVLGGGEFGRRGSTWLAQCISSEFT